MQKVCGLDYPPVFSPIVDDYYKGMAVTIQLQNRLLNGGPTAEDIYEKLAGWYDGQKLIKVHPFGYDGMIAAADMAGSRQSGADCQWSRGTDHGDGAL